MATQKPISTISYNSEAFLKEKLDGWLSSHIIQAYQYIVHKGEDGDKDHIHVRVEPNKTLDPMDLSEKLKEYPQGADKPLGVRPWRPSKEEDWFLYVVHDPMYLRLKYGGGDKCEKLPYKWQDIKVSEDYDVETAFIRAKASLQHSHANIATRIKSGASGLSLIQEGENPVIVNAIMRAVSDNDYRLVSDELHNVSERFIQLVEAVRSIGYDVTEEDGILKLAKIDTSINFIQDLDGQIRIV